MAIKYRKLSDYDKYLNFLVSEKRSFTTESTNYTKKIKESKDDIVIFNHEGDNDYSVLSLITMVRRDAKRFLENNEVVLNNEPNFFDLSESPPEGDVCKIDIKGAYWAFALDNGVISRETNKFLIDNYKNTKALKSARLKALGSLATHKRVNSYVDGVIVDFKEETQSTRDLYMYICSGIDQLMQRIVFEMNGAFYYYWDCVFSKKENEREVVDFILKQNYHTTTEETRIQTVAVGNHKYLFSNSDEKMYLIRKDKEFLLYDYNLFGEANLVRSEKINGGNILIENSNNFLRNKKILLNEF